MKHAAFLLILLVSLILGTTRDLCANQRTRFVRQGVRVSPYVHYRYRCPGPPKYYGGFHSRYFDTLGVPPGDVGLRGNGVYWMAW